MRSMLNGVMPTLSSQLTLWPRSSNSIHDTSTAPSSDCVQPPTEKASNARLTIDRTRTCMLSTQPRIMPALSPVLGAVGAPEAPHADLVSLFVQAHWIVQGVMG